MWHSYAVLDADEGGLCMTEQKNIEQQRPPVKVLLLGADLGKFDAERSMQELSALADANHMEVVAQLVQKRDAIDVATVVGEGKVAEAKLYCQNLAVETVIFDGELSGSQIRNLEQALEVEVIDRTMLILEIFSSRAVTNEGKLQTELATLRYRLPRLTGLGQSLSRQGGGGGGGGGARRGAGESKLEYDRRHLRRRIDALAQRLKELEARRGENRRARQKSGVPVISLVGYTNVGKSSLLNKLCGAEVLEANMLFATLDPTARKLTLPSGLNVVMVDTVGFVSRLPHHLVQAFQSTLEETAYSDIIIKVADASDPEREEQLQVTDEVLHELGCDDIPQLVVYNKCDAAASAFYPDVFLTSAKTGFGLAELLAELDRRLSDRMRAVKVLLPYDQLSLAAPMRQRGSVNLEEYRENGLYLEGIVKSSDLYLYEPYFI